MPSDSRYKQIALAAARRMPRLHPWASPVYPLDGRARQLIWLELDKTPGRETLHVHNVPVLCNESMVLVVEQIEKDPHFWKWGTDPRTGVCILPRALA